MVTEVDRARNLSDINTSYDTIPRDTIGELNVDGVFPIRRNPIRRKNRTPYLQLHFSPNFLLLQA